jgi:hypothetical protein
VLILVLETVSSAQEKNSAPTRTALSSAPRSGQLTILAELSKTVDAHKAHAGDVVFARVTQDLRAGDNVIPKGSKLTGHVEQARPLAKREADSTLEIVFDKVILKDGSELQWHAFLTAIGAAMPSDSDKDLSDPSAHVNDRSGCVPGMDAVRASIGQMNSASRPQRLTSRSVGVIGLSDLVLASRVSQVGMISVITSAKRNVKLENATQLVLGVLVP